MRLFFSATCLFATFLVIRAESPPESPTESPAKDGEAVLNPMKIARGDEGGKVKIMIYSPASTHAVLCTLLEGAVDPTETEIRTGLKELASQDNLETKDQGKQFADNYLKGMIEGFADKMCITQTSVDRAGVSFDANYCITKFLLIEKQLYPFLKNGLEEKLVNDYKFMIEQFEEGNPDELATRFNNLVAKGTNNKITEMVSADDLSYDQQLILANTIYFNDAWKTKMDLIKDDELEIILPDGSDIGLGEDAKKFWIDAVNKIDVDMLKGQEATNGQLRQGRYKVFTEKDYDFKAYYYPFKHFTNIRFVTFLPNVKFGRMNLPENEKGIVEIVKELLSAGTPSRVDFRIPKFSIKTKQNLSPLLKTVGIINLFKEDSHLKEMFPGEASVQIDEILQVATLELTELGLEAAAATSTVNYASASAQAATEFHCNQPFTFALVDTERDKLLFIGRYNRPDENVVAKSAPSLL